MKLKIHNRMFMDAWYSFSMLKFYYDHIIASLRESSKDFLDYTDKLENDYRENQKEFDKQRWLTYNKLYEEIYPGFFNNSFVISACSLFEFQIKKICNLIKEEHKMPFDWDVMNGAIPTKTKRFLRFAGVILTDDPDDFFHTMMPGASRIIVKELWKEIEN
jgi:phosphomannomutase